MPSMWQTKWAMQMYTEDKMIWFEKLKYHEDQTKVGPPFYALLGLFILGRIISQN